jgi:hypothetical protein
MLSSATNMGSGLTVPVIELLRTATKVGSEMKNSIKIGLDIHGVIDQDPDFFATIISMLRMQGNEVHILTGREITDELIEKLSGYGVTYDQLFSITTYHKEKGTYITYKNDDPTQPLIAPPTWDRTKGIYATKVGLDIHIDDSLIYGQFFVYPTQYIIYTPAVQKFLKVLAGWSARLEVLSK